MRGAAQRLRPNLQPSSVLTHQGALFTQRVLIYRNDFVVRDGIFSRLSHHRDIRRQDQGSCLNRPHAEIRLFLRRG